MIESPRSALLVGTAGHVDHGKTALLLALTGIDCDRWAEEKRRGITLDLGFAHLERDGVEIGFVDVPGHERFLHNALAGLGGIRLLLLVVAADAGIEQQTVEHLAIARLLGIPEIFVVLTKLDAADVEIADLVELEVAELLEGTPWRGAPVFRTSARLGEGIDALAEALFARAGAPASGADAGDPARLPIDRAFLLEGRGLIVTGTLARGAIHVGDELDLLPAGRRARVRGIQIHGRPRETAPAGTRTALQIAGLERDEIRRGDELATPGAWRVGRRLLARVHWLAEAALPLASRTPLRVHLYAADRMAMVRPLEPERLEPGGDGLVEIRLAGPVVAARGDRLVLRRPSPAATLGGGEVLDPSFRAGLSRRAPARRRALAGTLDQALETWIDDAGAAGATAGDLAERLGSRREDVAARLDPRVADGALVAAGDDATRRYFSPARLADLERRVRGFLAERLASDRLADGVSRAELVERALPGRAAEAAPFHLEWLAKRKVLAIDGDRVRPPGRVPQLTGEESGLAAKIVELYEECGLEPPSPAEAARRLESKPAVTEGLIKYLVGRRKLIRLPAGLLISSAAFERLVAELRSSGWERFSVQDFKERFGLSRKWAIPLLEHLDSTGVTRRLGDQRALLPARQAGGPAGSTTS